MIKVVVFVLVGLLGAWGHYAATAIADDVIHSDSPEAQAIAKKFLAADIPEKITTQVAWDAAVSFSASPAETMAKLEEMSKRQLTAMYYLVENWNVGGTSRFQRIWWKDMRVFVVKVQDLAGTLHTIAEDVKIQVEFNPKFIKGYRLIGYENRMLAAEDFADDTKDAGEIGAGHQVTVLYEIVTPDSPMKIDEVDLKYQNKKTTASDDWLTISLRYKDPGQDESKLIAQAVNDTHFNETFSENLKLASSVAEVGMLLRDSQHKGNSSYEMVLERLKTIETLLDDEYKSEFLVLVQKMQDLKK